MAVVKVVCVKHPETYTLEPFNVCVPMYCMSQRQAILRWMMNVHLVDTINRSEDDTYWVVTDKRGQVFHLVVTEISDTEMWELIKQNDKLYLKWSITHRY